MEGMWDGAWRKVCWKKLGQPVKSKGSWVRYTWALGAQNAFLWV